MGERKKDLAKVFAVTAVLLLTARGGGERVEKAKIPELKIQCPDPKGRTRLEDGATYRDLALSRTEAIAGWRRCFHAVEISQRQS